MARKQKPQPPEQEPELRISIAEADKRLKDRIAIGDEIRTREITTAEDLALAKSDYATWHAYNTDLLGRLFTTGKYADEYAYWGGGSFNMYASPQERIRYMRNDVTEQVRRLESLRQRLELVPLSQEVAAAAAQGAARPHTNRAFVVHGHDEAAREAVARFLEKLDIEAIVLHEQVTAGRTVVEKLEYYSDVDFAIVLLTPDDVGAAKDDADNLRPRARQNVVLELGYFVGKLGRNKVCALFSGPLELPSDIIGVVYVTLDAGGAWRFALGKEMRAAGFNVDLNLAV